jgi:GNAT superfamily N-acetyltransferase
VAVEIRPPHSGEWPACRMLLPRAFGRHRTPEVLLAFDEDQPANPQITGAVAYQRRGSQIGILDLRVLRTHRRKGVGTRLLNNLFSTAMAGGHSVISVFTDILANPDAGPFLISNGFQSRNRMFVVEADLERMLAGMSRLRDRLVSSGRVPSSARLVTPAEAPMDEVIRLFDKYIMDERCLRPEFFRASFSSARFDESSVILMVDGRVGGLLMVEWLRDIHRAEVPARVVVPEYRGGWANVLMMATALERGRAAGITRVRFESLEDNADTLSLARRFQADTIRVLDRFLRQVRSEDEGKPAY